MKRTVDIETGKVTITKVICGKSFSAVVKLTLDDAIKNIDLQAVKEFGLETVLLFGKRPDTFCNRILNAWDALWNR